ncbi:MAG: insulinase family protein [Ignavibacteriales bacterium]|nr:insulinase family protein [Ignavibacteriales bacterium]MCB9210480.1 insulinase family protein [Ignavibacteriales bacterium]MCB9219709.1 insulinase family protein [Ignavibacteriales bacterium]
MKDILNIKYEKFVLKNGLEVILYNNKNFPTVAVNVWYKVGSANEKPNKTGFAHLFEHMMFQGSKHIAKEMHFKFIQEAGGSLNGSTSMDRTNYYETLPSDSLELALWLESDRMGFLLPALTQAKLDNQKDVVMNERRQNYDNQPYGLAWEILFSNLFPSNHPYHWPTIGWMKDIENFNLNDVNEFFRDYYSPNNASLVIGGNFKKAEAKELVKKYFEEIKNGNKIKPVITNEINLKESKKIIHKDNVQLNRVYFAWHSDKGYGNDDAALDILADILAGSKNSRLYKKLVHEMQIAQDVSAFQYSAKYNGVFFIIISLAKNVETENVKEHLLEEIKKVVKKGITKKELERALNGYKSSYIYSLQNLDNLVNQINNYNCNLNEPNSFLYDLNRYNKLELNDITWVAEKYLMKNFIELDIIPK